MPWTDLATVRLDAHHVVHVGELPACVALDFELLWELHPREPQRVSMMGREIPLPRWSRAYGRDYHYSGRVDRAAPIPQELAGLLDWARTDLEPALDGLLLNWYDATQRHYIGRHRDSTRGLRTGAPVVTISLGAPRILRMRPWRGRGFRDLPIGDRGVVAVPWETNLAFTHEVPHRARDTGRRISITLRAFA